MFRSISKLEQKLFSLESVVSKYDLWPMRYFSANLLPYEVGIFQHYIEFYEIGHCAASINYPAMD